MQINYSLPHVLFDPNRVSREEQYMRRLKVSLVEFGMGSGGSY